MPATIQPNCKTCGRPLGSGGVEGLCELCLLEAGWRGYDEAEPDGPPVRRAAIWRQVGEYELTGEIARGGMGVVYRARQPSLDRDVALKMILAGHWASEAQVERFRLEARASARLDHPNIVPVLELGEHDGWHYYTMRLIDGEDLARQMSAGRWPAADRAGQERIARLLQCVAEAVHFAHQHGILHRDLKPTNVLLDRAGVPFVTDFGLAKWIEETGDLTRTSAVMGTPVYMAPEQAAGRTEEVTVAADVYSLGAILYELLAGRPPHQASTPLEMIRCVVEKDITPVNRLNPAVDPDLANIVAKCLHRERAGRYGSAHELAEDLGRWLRREPIQARAATPLEKLGYWTRRNPWIAALSSALLLVLVLTAVISSTLAVRMREARDEARVNAEENRRRLSGLLVETGLRRGAEGDPVMALPWLVAALRTDAGDPARELAHRTRLASVLHDLPRLEALWFHERLIQHAALSADGRRAATASYDGTVRVWDTETGAEIGPPRRHTHDGPGLTLLLCVAFSPDGTRVASGGNRDARLWDVASGRLIGRILTHSNEVRAVEFSPDGSRILSASTDHTVRVWDAATGEPIGNPMRHEAGVLNAMWSPDGRWIVSGGRDRVARVWNAATGRPHAVTGEHDGEISHVEFSPDGEHFVTASRSATVRVWRTSDAALISTLNGSAAARRASFSPEGHSLLTGGSDGRARIWDWRTGRERTSLAHGLGAVVWVGWSADGKRALTASPGRVQVWDASSGRALTPPLPHTHTLCHAELSRDGMLALAVSLDGTARLWRLPVNAPSAFVPQAHLRAFGPDGRHAILREEAGGFTLRDLREQAALNRRLPPELANAYSHSLDESARRLALQQDGRVTVFDLGAGEPRNNRDPAPRELAAWPAPERCSLRLSPDGSLVALFGPPEALVFDALSGAPVGEPLRHGALIRQAVFSADNLRILTVSDDSTARVWETATGRALTDPLRHDDVVVFGAFSPDGQWVVTTGYDGTARVWSADDGRPVLPPMRHGALVFTAGFSMDQRRLVTVAAGHQARVWNLADGRPVTPPLAHGTGIHYAAFPGDDSPLLTVTDDLRFQLWDLPSGQPLLVVPGTSAVRPVDDQTPADVAAFPWWKRLPVESRPLEELERQAVLLSGQVVEGEGGLLPVDVVTLRRAWEGDRADGSPPGSMK